MKNLIVFLAILLNSLSNSVFACWFYPYGEEVRFQLIHQTVFDIKGYEEFMYSSENFHPQEESYEKINDSEEYELACLENLKLWRKRYNNVPLEKDVYEAIYGEEGVSYDANSKNNFIKLLHQKKDFEALQYIEFIQKCTVYNAFYDDPWERNQNVTLPKRAALIQKAVNKIEQLKDDDLKRRYAFIAIRLAYYNQDFEMIKTLYEQNFSEQIQKNILDYWAMYFFAMSETDPEKSNFLAAQVFVNAPDKRFMVQQFYDKSFDIEQTLSFATTNQEKAAVWFLEGIKSPDKALESIKKLYELDPNSKGINVLIIRELNKLEDWIYTPYYTYFAPSVGFADDSEMSIQSRILLDRKYAREFLDFLNTISATNFNTQAEFKIAKAYLALMAMDFESCLKFCSESSNIKKDDLRRQFSIIKALCLTASQNLGSAVVKEEVQQTLLKEFEAENVKFIFAISKELELKGNKTDAALILSKLENLNSELNWKTSKFHCTVYNADYYTNYFFYLDAAYSSFDVQNLINAVVKNKEHNEFLEWKFSALKKNLYRMYDLLGTKFLRENKLNESLMAFQNVPNEFWQSEQYSYPQYLNSNPFYTNFYNEHTATKADTISYNKESIVRQLIVYLNKAKDEKNPKKDYYYFLAANCYLNMTYYGNSWMMRRYWWSGSIEHSGLIDEDEYLSADLAKKYYLKAYQVSKNAKFKALSLRMAARCENYSLVNIQMKMNNYDEIQQNQYIDQINSEFPQYSDDLISNCESFDSYFNERF